MDLISLWLIPVALFGGVVLVNAIQRSRLEKRLTLPAVDLDPNLANTWKSSRIHQFLASNAETTAAGTISTGHAIFHLSRLEPEAMAAVNRIYQPEKINSFRELVEHLDSKRVAGEEAWQGTINNYKGALGETVIGAQLEAQGHVVVHVKDTSNPGFDAWVDGQPTQFKSGLNPEQILVHKARYPDIPVVTVGEHSEQFANDPMVKCLNGVSGQAIEETTSSAMGSAIEIDDFIEGIPAVTAMISGFRHFIPVVQGDSDIVTAAKYTIADTAGIGVGSASGAKLGALVGMIFGPIGSGIGAAVGGISGAMVGKFAANAIKSRSLESAQTDLMAALAKYPPAYVEALKVKAHGLRDAAKTMRSPLRLKNLILPSAGDVIRLQGRMAMKRWARYCLKISEEIQKSIVKTNKSDTPTEALAAMARTWLSNGLPEPVFSKSLIDVGMNIQNASEAVKSELRKLGRA